MKVLAACRRCGQSGPRASFLTQRSLVFGALPTCPRCHSTDVDVFHEGVLIDAHEPPRPPNPPARSVPNPTRRARHVEVSADDGSRDRGGERRLG